MLENTNSEGVINETVEPKLVVVNGVSYTEIPKPMKKSKDNTKMGAMFEMYAQLVLDGTLPSGMDLSGFKKYERTLPSHVNVVEEFGLVQLKQSKLCRWDRDEVERIFNKNFKLV